MGYQRTDSNHRVFSTWPTMGSRKTIVTPNWCDKTTWYQAATRTVDAAGVAQGGEYFTYLFPNTNIIDTYHGKIFGEDFLTDADDNSYRMVVEVNGSAKVERDPHQASGGDYEVDYGAGTVTFFTELTAGDDVTATYHYAGSSEFCICPSVGKVLQIKNVEVQFSGDLVINDTVTFVAYGLVDVYAPQLMPGVPSGTKIPIRSTVYKAMKDFVDEANGSLPAIPAMGGAGWRGMQEPVYVFPWNYQALMGLPASTGLEVRIKLEHDTPFGGSLATATFYCLPEDE